MLIIKVLQSFVVMSIDGSGMETTSSQDKTALRYSGEVSKPYVEGATKLHSARNENGEETTEVRDSVQEDAVGQPKRGAKIHDFCFGIPYGKALFKISKIYFMCLSLS